MMTQWQYRDHISVEMCAVVANRKVQGDQAQAPGHRGLVETCRRAYFVLQVSNQDLLQAESHLVSLSIRSTADSHT